MNAQVFRALGDPSRLRILELLRERPRSVNEVANSLGLRQPQSSKHLQTLHRVGLVSVHPRAQQRIYALQPDAFRDLDAWLSSFERNWNEPTRNISLGGGVRTRSPRQAASSRSGPAVRSASK